MTRTTIDYGIDLGTTNSAVAVMRGIEAEIIKNNEGGDVTPSAVHINKSERLLVGRLAKQRIESDPDNTASEFKLRMGTTGQAATFARTGRRMEPEELSAEVLKSLRDDVRQYTQEEIDAAVITVPAAFELNQTDATKRAAEMAGLTFAPLIQEPTAAALAYAFQSDADGQFWLVYDLGGGTFDASIVHLDQGEFSVVNHRGDNFLGGKLIDWAIVEQLLIPAMAAEHSLEGLARGAPEARKVVAALKLAAEEAKIRLSRERSVDVTVERLPRPGGGDPIDFEYELTREDVERLAAPFYARSVNICRAALAEARLEPKAIERVLLVGGPTLAPHLREVLDAELGIEPDISQDPLTVVARGAAIFAATQDFPSGLRPPKAGHCRLELDYRPAGPDTEPLVGGRLVSDDGPLPDGLALEFENAEARPAWRSGKVPVGSKGTFVTQLWAEKGRRNTFGVVLTDGAGRRLDVDPDEFPYTCGIVETKPLLQQTLGLALVDNGLRPVLRKGTALPSRATVTVRTVVDVEPGSGTGVIRIPVMEGEHARADRNRRVGRLEVRPTMVTRRIPAGSEVEVTMEVDASRIVETSAYVGLVEAEFAATIDLPQAVPEQTELRRDLEGARHRYEEVGHKVRATGDLQARAALEQIDGEDMVDGAAALVDASRDDPDAAITGAKRIGDLEAALDDVEAALEWPERVKKAEDLIATAHEVVDKAGAPDDVTELRTREAAVRDAIATKDASLLERRCTDLAALVGTILDRTGLLQLEFFDELKGRRREMTDQRKADRLFDEGDRAIATHQITVLKNVNRQLNLLLPQASRAIGDDASTVA